MTLLTLASIATPILEAKEQAKETVVVVLLGPPGAGKGTQATMLSSALHLPHISTGNLLRTHVQQKTSLGREAKTFMDQGKLVPDKLILDMLFDRVAQEDCRKGYILDGFPRTLTQAQAYHNRLGDTSRVVALNLELSDEIIVERLSQRLVCNQCSAPYHTKYSPPQAEGVCDHCQGELIQRTDDTEEVIRKRLAVYHQETAPLITYYAQEQSFQTISCNQPIENVLEEILGCLREIYESITNE